MGETNPCHSAPRTGSPFFFFQAEDGIRDLTVTGVQTCALPICRSPIRRCSPRRWKCPKRRSARSSRSRKSRSRWKRSEERRVGKECRSRWSPYHHKKKQELSLRIRGSDCFGRTPLALTPRCDGE